MSCLGVLLSSALILISARAESTALQFHCAGIAQLAAGTDLVTLRQVFASSPAIAFRKLAVSRMSSLLAQSWHLSSNSAPLIEPLLADVVENESLGVLGPANSNGAGFVLAVRAGSQRARAWPASLGKVLGEPGEEFMCENVTGRRWSKSPLASFWIVPAGDWVLFGRGNDFGPLRSQYLLGIARNNRASTSLGTNWLESDLDLNLLADLLPDWAKLLKPAQLHISVAPSADNLDINGRVTYSAAPMWEPVPWREPRETVRSPLISFTVGRDVSAFLRFSPRFSNFDNSPLTNQFYAWAIGLMPLQSYMAWPVPDATNDLKRLSPEMQSAFNPILKKFNGTQLQWLSEQKKLVWSKLQVVAPTIEPARDDGRDFLLLSLFPLGPPMPQAPAKLWDQLDSRANLVYYDWELTGRRLQQMRMLPGLLWFRPETGAGDEPIDGLLVKDTLLGSLGNDIGATVTVVTHSGPDELSITRKGPLGFTGMELVLLSDWLANAGSR
jgi:hypothetical protein